MWYNFKDELPEVGRAIMIIHVLDRKYSDKGIHWYRWVEMRNEEDQMVTLKAKINIGIQYYVFSKKWLWRYVGDCSISYRNKHGYIITNVD